MASISTEIFALPILDKFLIYAPLHSLIALVDQRALAQIQRGLSAESDSLPEAVASLVRVLRLPGEPHPSVRTGPIAQPLFLGIIPTRGCNMACRYCDFAAPKKASQVMSLELVRSAIDGYLQLLVDCDQAHAEVHFFGGEPFSAPDVVHFAVGYARHHATSSGLSIRFEATTNGLYSAGRCQWIAEHFDAIVLSLDGPAALHDQQRPALNGRGTFEVVARTAKILSEGSVDLILRVCVTEQTVAQLSTIAQWICQEFRPSTVCFESLTPSPLAAAANLTPPDPWRFAQNFTVASRILDSYGIQTVLSTAALDNLRTSFCPVGKDALIVTPNGMIHACYLLEEDWRQKGLDMHLGRVDVSRDRLCVDTAALQRVRQLNVYHKSLCDHCFCRFHCAGGCHVNHDTAGTPGQFTDLCIQTRLVTIAALLRQMGQDHLLDAWFADRQAQQESVWRTSDRLMEERAIT